MKIKLLIFLLIGLNLISCNDDNSTTNIEIEKDTNPYLGNVILTTQLEVDNFGVMNYTSISGDLTIKQPQNAYESNINDLDKLQTLTSIGYDLIIMYNYNLKNLNGLNDISNVGRDLNIQSNRNLTNINGLEKLTTINRNLIIYGNEKIGNLDAFSNLTTVKGDLTIAGNGNSQSPLGLNNFCGLTKLIKSNGLKGTYNVANNKFNPSKQDIISGNCIE